MRKSRLVMGEEGLVEAARYILRGGIVAYPTETFYALGCSALNPYAVSRVYGLKRRMTGKPLPVLASSVEILSKIVSLDDLDERLTALWPSPLTVILPAIEGSVAKDLLDAHGCVAVRVTSHPTAAILSSQTGLPITASSANLAGEQPARNAQELDSSLELGCDLVLDCGPLPGGILPSTIVLPLEGGRLRLIREGSVSTSILQNAGFEIVRG